MIKTERLIIRNFEERDRSPLVALLMDKEFMTFSLNGPFSYESANLRFTKILSSTSEYIGKKALISIETGEIIGYCGIESFTLNGSQENEFGYRLAIKYRGNGIATEAAKAVLSTVPTDNLYAYVEKENEKSIKVLKKIGFISRGSCVVEMKQYLLFKFNS